MLLLSGMLLNHVRGLGGDSRSHTHYKYHRTFSADRSIIACFPRYQSPVRRGIDRLPQSQSHYSRLLPFSLPGGDRVIPNLDRRSEKKENIDWIRSIDWLAIKLRIEICNSWVCDDLPVDYSRIMIIPKHNKIVCMVFHRASFLSIPIRLV